MDHKWLTFTIIYKTNNLSPSLKFTIKSSKEMNSARSLQAHADKKNSIGILAHGTTHSPKKKSISCTSKKDAYVQ